MSWLEALLLGILQGLTEFLPVSSSGHLELGKELLNIVTDNNLLFTVIVHFATVLSIIIVFRNDLKELILGFIEFKCNTEMKFIVNIFISMVPIIIVGFLWEHEIEKFFNGRIMMVGFMLIITAFILFLTKYAKADGKNVSLFQSLIIGLAQAIAILPGISRSGATIGTALMLGVDKSKATRFSFLMVLFPIIGITIMKTVELTNAPSQPIDNLLPLVVGFLAAFFSGLAACTWMIKIVKKGKLIYFAIYCLILGLIAISYKVFFY